MKSEYELQREANMRENRATLVSLGIEKLQPVVKPKPLKGASVNKREKKEQVPPRERSLRQRNLDVEGNQTEALLLTAVI